MESRQPESGRAPPRAPIFAVLQIGLLALLIYACARIIVPFAGILLWSLILAVMLYPLHVRLSARIGNRWSAVLIGIVGVALLLVPMIMLATSLASSIFSLVSGLQHHTLTVPPPHPRLAEIPVVGQRLTEAWALVATNLPAALARYGHMLREPITWLTAFAGRLAAGELAFVLAFVIATILVAYGTGAANFARRLVALLTGSWTRGVRMTALTAATIRGVAVGIIGVAVIQAMLLAVGFFAIGLAPAALLTLAALLLGIVQVPATLLTLPVIAYVFGTEPIVPAIIFAVWTLIAGLSDNALKPLMLGRGLEVPMPVVLIGVLGGMVVDGLLGLFVGPVLLAVAYMLFIEWFHEYPADGAPQAGDPAP